LQVLSQQTYALTGTIRIARPNYGQVEPQVIRHAIDSLERRQANIAIAEATDRRPRPAEKGIYLALRQYREIVDLDTRQIAKPHHIGLVQAQIDRGGSVSETVHSSDDIHITPIQPAVDNGCNVILRYIADRGEHLPANGIPLRGKNSAELAEALAIAFSTAGSSPPPILRTILATSATTGRNTPRTESATSGPNGPAAAVPTMERTKNGSRRFLRPGPKTPNGPLMLKSGCAEFTPGHDPSLLFDENSSLFDTYPCTRPFTG
jgi:hypothetical protein